MVTILGKYNPENDSVTVMEVPEEKHIKEIIRHFRFDDGSAVTSVTLEEGKGNPVAVGWAICNLKDQFSRKRGVMIALGRAEKALARKKSFGRIISREVSNLAFEELISTTQWKAQYIEK